MASERWQQVEALYQAALERAAAERDQFLDERCGDDRALREEVESLVRYGGATHAFFDAPAVELAVLGEEQSLIGARLGADHPEVALTCNNLGRLLNDCGRRDEAVVLLERAVAVLEQRLIAGHPHLARARDNLRAARGVRLSAARD